MGAPARRARASGREPAGRAHGGSPARVPGLPRRDPEGRVRRRDDEDLGQRDLRGREVPQGRGDRHLPRRARPRPLRAVSDAREELDDPPDGSAGGPGVRAVPRPAAPMLARSGPLPPREEQFGFEVKWDGIRTVLYSDHGHVELRGRNGTDFTKRYPEVRELARSLGSRRIVLDGEIVAFDEEGRPSFERLQSRMHLASDSAVRRRMRDIPATYVIFDLLYLDGHSTTGLFVRGAPPAARPARARGAGLARAGVPPRRGEGAARGDARARDRGHRREEARLPVPARRACVALDQGEERPHAGRRDRRLDARRGGRTTSLGSLAAGVMEDGELVYCGKVGTGFTEQSLALLKRELEPLARDTSPFSGRQPPKGTQFVEPLLVAHVEFREWTGAGRSGRPRSRASGPTSRRRNACAMKVKNPLTGTFGACHAQSGAVRSASGWSTSP